jgi:hypothetical protein
MTQTERAPRSHERAPVDAGSKNATGARRGAALAALVLLSTPMLLASPSQQQQPNRGAGWPCGARLDPSYFQIAEGSGGHLLMLAPEEIGDSAALLIAFGNHPQTVFRLAGSITAGLHEFSVPIDSSIESVLFSVSVQCMQLVEILRPSGAAVSAGDGVTDYATFRGQRMAIVSRPEPGPWTVRVSGSGVSAVVVQAQSAIAIGQVEFAPVPAATFSPIPAFGVENAVRIRVSGPASGVRAALVSGVLQLIANLRLSPEESAGSYLTRFSPGPGSFRLLVSGTDDRGFAFQRMHAPLLTPRR